MKDSKQSGTKQRGVSRSPCLGWRAEEDRSASEVLYSLVSNGLGWCRERGGKDRPSPF